MKTEIHVLSNQPPGGRCALYRRYAEALAEMLDGTVLIDLPPFTGTPGRAPALLIGDTQVLPGDGETIGPCDVCAVAATLMSPVMLASLYQRLVSIVEEMPKAVERDTKSWSIKMAIPVE